MESALVQYNASYYRTKKSKIDPVSPFYAEIESLLHRAPELSCLELHEELKQKGYRGSVRTLQRKLSKKFSLRKEKQVYFQREKIPGEIMEGDFTEFPGIKIGGVSKKIYLWVVSLVYSNKIFATPFYHQNFECFAEGTVEAFEYFGGVAKKYRLDNLSPAVIKILKGKDRITTQRYQQLQRHYGFFEDFCNPGCGHEKGNVESNNKHFKKTLRNRLMRDSIEFLDLESFRQFVWKFCEERNNTEDIILKSKEENLSLLPPTRFEAYHLSITRVNKFSVFNHSPFGHQYSVPSEYVGLTVEVRAYSNKIVVLYQGDVIAEHKRLYGMRGLASIQIEDVITSLSKKPGAMADWKHKEILFERPVFKKFYEKLEGKENRDRHFLLCLSLMKKHNKENVSVAMELLLSQQEAIDFKSLSSVLENRDWSVLELEPMRTNLTQYDFLISQGGKHGFTKQS